jgi:hypothetical protein
MENQTVLQTLRSRYIDKQFLSQLLRDLFGNSFEVEVRVIVLVNELIH